MANTVLCRITGGEVRPEFLMPTSATIIELKERIEEYLGVEVARQTLWSDRVRLRNYLTFDLYGFRQVATMILAVRPLPPERQKFAISVKSSVAEVNVRVRETSTVGDLRRKIERLWGIPGRLMTLFRLNKEMEFYVPLSAYYISEGSQVEVRITVEPR